MSEIVEFFEHILPSVITLEPRAVILYTFILVQNFDFGNLVGTIIGQRALSIDCESGPGIEVPVPFVTVFGLWVREFFLRMKCLESDLRTGNILIGICWIALHLFLDVGKPAILFESE